MHGNGYVQGHQTKMPMYDLPHETDINFSDGVDRIFVYVAGQVPILVPMILTSFCVIVLLSIFFLQERRTGKGDFPAAFAISTFLTATLAILMSIIDGLINLTTLVTTLSIAFGAFLWLMFSRD